MRTRLTIALLAATPFVATLAQTGAPRAQTANGAVVGITLPSGVKAFRGVPFAAPPVRENRWRPPQPVKSWTGTRLADRFADQCMQARVFGDMMFRNAGVSEDCLYLNVWMPASARPGSAMPVLVYYYGGGFVAGDGSEPRYDGESMAKRGIVVVTMSYRLGIFGFFSHPELTAESPHHASGNYSLMDQAAALQWVRDNIARFGGDPKRVTIAGESAGSFGASFAQKVGASNLAALRALSATELLDWSSRPGVPRFSANVDGYFFPDLPANIFLSGKQAKVPLLAGWNSEEMN